MLKRNLKILILISCLISVSACQANRSHIGAVLGGTTTTGSCVAMGVNDPYAIGACAMIGAFAGANIMYKSDYDVHNAVFVDHLNTAPNTPSYTNWFNSKTGNNGTIKTTKSYHKGPIKCTDYEASVNITNNWPLIGIGDVNRDTIFGVACQMPDGQWVEYYGKGNGVSK